MQADVNARMEAMHFARMVSDEVLSSPTAVEMYRAWAEFVRKHVSFAPGGDPARDMLVKDPTASSALGANYRPTAADMGGAGGSGSSGKYRSPISKEFFVSLVRVCLCNLYEHFPGLLLAGMRKPAVERANRGRLEERQGHPNRANQASLSTDKQARAGAAGSESAADSSTGFFDTFGSNNQADEEDELDELIGSTYT